MSGKITLARVPGNRIALSDEHGERWWPLGIGGVDDGRKCARCGGRVGFGYAPWRDSRVRSHCDKCVVIVDARS